MNPYTKKEPYVASPNIKLLRQQFDELIRLNEEFNTANCMLITGESGSGKSELAKRYLASNPIFEDETGIKQPVLHLEIKTANTPKDVLTSLLIGISDPQMGQGARNASELFTRFVRLSKTIKLKLIIIDEVQVIIERRSEKVISGIGDLFKDLIKETGIPIVFMGMPWTRYLIDSNPQLNGRISIRHTMPTFKVSDSERFNDFVSFFKAIAKAYELPGYFQEPNKDLLLRSFSYSKGNVRKLSHLLRSIFIFSITNKQEASLQTIGDIVASFGYLDTNNPYKLKITDVVIEENITESDFLFAKRTKGNSIIAPEIAKFRISKDLRIYPVT